MADQMLKAMIEVLGREFGPTVVREEALLQSRVYNVDRLAVLLDKSNTKIARIKVVHAMAFLNGLKEAKEWVEDHFEDRGCAPFS